MEEKNIETHFNSKNIGKTKFLKFITTLTIFVLLLYMIWFRIDVFLKLQVIGIWAVHMNNFFMGPFHTTLLIQVIVTLYIVYFIIVSIISFKYNVKRIDIYFYIGDRDVNPRRDSQRESDSVVITVFLVVQTILNIVLLLLLLSNNIPCLNLYFGYLIILINSIVFFVELIIISRFAEDFPQDGTLKCKKNKEENQ